MSRTASLVAVALAIALLSAAAQTPTASDVARAMVGAWEISNAARDKTCPLTLGLETVEGGRKLELDPGCRTAFPSLKDVGAWAMGPSDSVRLLDLKGMIVLELSEVESRIYEGERKGEGLFFMRTQEAIKEATITPDRLFGDWTLLQEFEKPLCKLTLSNASAGAETYKIVVKRGCVAAIAEFAPSTWRLDSNELLLSGRSGTWRFAESDESTWERIPPSTNPLLMMRQ
jgi:hypothetical protein